MQVKKFEARTMQEALEMVKSELGPEAIILSARDNQKRFGLVGEGSVEVTAAISDETLRMKQFTESRMRLEDKSRLTRAPAKQQRQVIEKFVNNHFERKNSQIKLNQERSAAPAPIPRAVAPRPATNRRYIDIEDDGHTNNIQTTLNHGSAERVQLNESSVSARLSPTATAPTEEIKSLKTEINELKRIIETFKSMPQSFSAKHPGADYNLPYELSPMFERLIKAGIQEDYAAEILSGAAETLGPLALKKKTSIDTYVAKYFLNHVLIKDTKSDSKLHLFVGGHAQGKTTTLIKLAAQLVLKEKKRIAILTTDTVKVGASEQLKTYAQILNVPYAVIKTQGDWVHVENQLEKFDAILVDYPGFNLKNEDEVTFMISHLPPVHLKASVHLVISAASKDETAFELGRRYDVVNYSDVIFTSLDEAVRHGVIYNFQKRFNKPLHSFGLGPKVPEDIEMATRERVLDLIFKISNLKSGTERE